MQGKGRWKLLSSKGICVGSDDDFIWEGRGCGFDDIVVGEIGLFPWDTV